MREKNTAIANAMEDEHYFVMSGRRWRKTDPSVPPMLKSQLVRELMAARRAVKTAKAIPEKPEAIENARARVDDAKRALGERGYPWWEVPDPSELADRLGATIRTLLRHRTDGKTLCPSEAARVVGGSRWKECMEASVSVAWRLEKSGWLTVTQSGERVHYPTTGPIRLRRVKSIVDSSGS